ncbi:ELMO domain-containing protein 2-like [Scylla paramamosain]|uniref:ELMO domain-containing protein n=1 Tax=Scylla olivacea TaxID=85551 RepID=A0A0P4WCI2_SCYOL
MLRLSLRMFGLVWVTVYWWVRPMVKWLLRRTTGLCELQRVCYGEQRGAQRTQGVEFSLEHSRTPEIQKCMKYIDGKCQERTLNQELIYYVVFAIVKIKKINTQAHKGFSDVLGQCLTQIWGFRQLSAEVEAKRREMYDPANPQHEEKLKALWELMMPDTQLEARVTKQWQMIGFQGDDPQTDFRGMGVLGLENLLFFAEHHTSAARHVLARSLHPTWGYSFAIVGINITHLAYSLLQSGAAKTHFYNASKRFLELRAFHQFYCHLFFSFDEMWRQEKPKDIMEFSRIRDKFEAQVKLKLKNPLAFFKCNFVLENV